MMRLARHVACFGRCEIIFNFFFGMGETTNIVVEWLTFLLCIREVLGSDLGAETGYPG
jgi:hypothetical protein